MVCKFANSAIVAINVSVVFGLISAEKETYTRGDF